MKVEHLAYDLFMLMLNLARLKSKEPILTTFLEAMNNLPVDLSCRLLSTDEPAPTGKVIEIATPQNSFGRILLEGSLVEQRHEFLTLIRNAICMLAIILENQIQMQLLRREINERKQIEQELRQSEERLTLAITGIGGALWDEELDPEATFDDLSTKVYHSPEAKKLLGYQEDNDFPDSIAAWDDHVLPEDRPLREKRQRDHFEGRTEFLDHEYRVRRKDGSVRWIQGRSRIIRDERGRPIRWIGLDWDITGRKQAEEELRKYREHLEELVKERTADLLRANEKLEQEIAEGLQTKEALRESEEKYRLVVENANEGIVVAQDGLLKFFNSRVVEITGYSEAELLAKSFAELIHPDDREMVVERHFRRLRGEQPPDTYSFRIIGGGDSIKWVELRTVLIDWEGKPATLNFLSNVTERRQTEEALTRSEATLRSIFRAAPTGIGLVSNRMLLQVNDRICQMSGYTSDELIGQNARILYPSDEDYEYVGREKYAQIRECGTGTVETRWQHKDGRVIDVLLSSIPLDPDDLSIGVTFTALDITDRKRSEAEIRQLNEELEQRVIERTAQLEAVNQELKEFAYMVSHDLKAPLRAISQLANWLLVDHADALDQEGQELLELIISRTKRMHNLIEGILQYSRIGRITERERNVDLNLLVQETIEMLAPPEHIQITIEEPLPTVLGERTRFEQVFQNLLSNAIKFIDKPKGQIRINCIDEKTHWCFSVSDNGPGIEERYYAKIFQVFQTLSPRDKVESTGIGLALVKKIVETWGGKIWLESTVGQGSTFLFTLPRKGKQDGEER